ncbi:MAG: hypothetical protein FJX39_03530 [Alphaproteobacteria bacterium]|nr:hypothetical protein [Alphaproteobacteria bacterium]
MKKLLILAAFIPNIAFAGEAFECHKNHASGNSSEIICTAKQDNVAVDEIKLNGGNCPSPVHEKIHHKVMMKGEGFVVPGTKECGYVSGMSIKDHNGKTHHFHAM